MLYKLEILFAFIREYLIYFSDCRDNTNVILETSRVLARVAFDHVNEVSDEKR